MSNESDLTAGRDNKKPRGVERYENESKNREFIATLSAIITRESQAGHFPGLQQMSRPLVDIIVEAAKQASAGMECLAFDLLFIVAKENPKHWFLSTAASRVALEDGKREVASHLAEQAMNQMTGDLYSQELWMHSRTIKGESQLAAINEDLSGRFCDRPFRWMEFTGNASFVCCPSWLPTPIGPAPVDPNSIWNGRTAQEIRRSILDGSFRYCSRIHCPWIAKKALPKREQIQLSQYALEMPPPTNLNLCYDESCNLSCPSCRTHTQIAGEAKQAQLQAFYEKAVSPLIPTAKMVNITGSGDPFASRHFRRVLRTITQSGGPLLDIQTNGVLFDGRVWDEFALEGRVRRVWVSLDAASKSVYEIVRRGGDFERAKENVRDLVRRKSLNQISFVGLDFVVQRANIDEMLSFIWLGIELGVDSVRFNMIRNWGTFSGADFADHFVGSAAHTSNAKLSTILSDLLFAHPIVDPGNLWRFADKEFADDELPDRDVLHV